MANPGQRYEFIDAIRGIAAMAVVAEHSLEAATGQVSQSFSFGMFGVIAFLFVSGFVVPVSLERTQSLAKFWIGRFFRLYPLYWLSLILVAPFAPTAMGFDRSNPIHWLANATMFQQFAGIGHAQNSYWTLTIEMVLYLTYSILFWRGWLSNSLRNGWIVASAVLVVGAVFPIALHHRLPGGSSGEYLLCILMAFVGTTAYRYFKGKVGAGQFARFATTAAVIGCVVGYALYDLLRGGANVPLAFAACETSWLAALGFVLVGLSLSKLAFPILSFVGRISYSIYLLHTVVLHYMPAMISPLAFILSVCLGSVAVSAFTYRFIEQPCEQFGKSLQKKLGGSADLPEAI